MLNARTTLAGQDIILAIHMPDLCLTALPLSNLEGHWSQSPDHRQWELITLDPEASFRSDHQEHNAQGKLVLPLQRLDAADGPWVLAIHVATPTWRCADAHPEIIVIAFGRTGDLSRSRRLLAYKAQLLPSQRLKLLAQSCMPADTVPWDPNCVTNAGRMFELWDKEVLAYSLFAVSDGISSTPRPKKIDLGEFLRPVEERVPTTCAADPYSGAVAIGTPGLVRVFHFD